MRPTSFTTRECSRGTPAPSLDNIHSNFLQDCNCNTFNLQGSIIECAPELHVRVPPGSEPPSIRSSPTKSWMKNYSALSFLMNRQLFAEYDRVSGSMCNHRCNASIEQAMHIGNPLRRSRSSDVAEIYGCRHKANLSSFS